MRKKTAQPLWKNRIVGHADVDPVTLIPHPENWRVHPDMQKNAMEGAFQELGWLQSITVSQRTGNILDGHMRVLLAIDAGAPTVPVEYVDVSEDDERKALVTINPLAAMFEANDEAVAQLLRQVQTDEPALQHLLDALGQKQSEMQERPLAYQPQLAPQTGQHVVTQQDMQQASGVLQKTIHHQRDLRPVLCPTCATEFFIEALPQ